ncbi:MAG: hypothetical protein WBA07_04730 [Rivularia sp. (in: cyanobacteria)]
MVPYRKAFMLGYYHTMWVPQLLVNSFKLFLMELSFNALSLASKAYSASFVLEYQKYPTVETTGYF